MIKKMNRLTCLVFILSLAVPAFAADVDPSIVA